MAHDNHEILPTVGIDAEIGERENGLPGCAPLPCHLGDVISSELVSAHSIPVLAEARGQQPGARPKEQRACRTLPAVRVAQFVDNDLGLLGKWRQRIHVPHKDVQRL